MSGYLAYPASGRNRIVHHCEQRKDLPPRLGAFGREEHAVALDAAEFRRLEVAEDDYFFAFELFRLVEVSDARNDGALFIAEVEVQDVEFVGLWNYFYFFDERNAQVELGEVVVFDLRLFVGVFKERGGVGFRALRKIARFFFFFPLLNVYAREEYSSWRGRIRAGRRRVRAGSIF